MITTTLDGFKPVSGHEKYLVNDVGDIFSTKTNKLLNPSIDGRGYKSFIVVSKGIAGATRSIRLRVHKAVADAFVPNPIGFQCINHIDGDKLNNCIKNLEWCSYSDNLYHAYKLKLHKKKLSKEDIGAIKAEYVPNVLGAYRLARKYGVTNQTIYRVLKGQYGHD